MTHAFDAPPVPSSGATGNREGVPSGRPGTNPAERFVAQRETSWTELAEILRLESSLHKLPPDRIARAAALYREVCTDRMRADHLGCPPDVITQLDRLVARAHNALYSSRRFSLRAAWALVFTRFPQEVRANKGPFLLANLLFWSPFVYGLIGALESQRFAANILPASMLEHMAEAYAEGFAYGRDGSINAAMAGFYVYNNVGIAFRCFATGILFGAGSLFFLVYNGLVTGTVVGHVIRTGGGVNILTFVAGHAPLELTAIVISGAAGLQMGRALIATGGLTRLSSLWAARHALAAQVAGAAVMLLIAALIEGFWSPSSIPPPIKWSFGGVMACLVTVFLVLGGRKTPSSDGAVRATEPAPAPAPGAP